MTSKNGKKCKFIRDQFTYRKFLSAILVLTLTLGTYRVALAEEKDADTPITFESRGKIIYQNGSDEVVIDSDDFYKLAARLDLFKHNTVQQLKVMNTYFTTGEGIAMNSNEAVRIAHVEPAEENMVDASQLDFSTLLEGIALSQSVPSDVAAAAADNLTAGTAAWVGGQLVRGTGKDNEDYYNQGKQDSVRKIVFSLYNNQTKKSALPSKSLYISVHQSADNTRSDSFSYTSDPIYLYQDMDGDTAVLNTISFSRAFSQHHGSGYGCHCKLTGSVNVNLYLEDGSCIFSSNYNLGSYGSGSLNTMINLFDYDLGDNTYCYLQISGTGSIKSEGHSYENGVESTTLSMSFDNASVSHIPIDID